jgi:hypothetical protein
MMPASMGCGPGIAGIAIACGIEAVAMMPR